MNDLIYAAQFGSFFPSRAANTVHIIRMCEALTRLGYGVTLVASKGDHTKHEIDSYYGVVHPFQVTQIAVPPVRGKSILYALRAFAVIRDRAPDFVIGRATHICMLAALGGTKVVYDVHGPIWEKDIAERVSFEVLKRSRNLAKMTVNSVALKSLYELRGKLPKVGIEVAHNGAFPQDLYVRVENWPGRRGPLQAGYFGHLYAGRGIELIMECARALPQMDFHIVGGVAEDVAHWKAKSHLSNLHFHGFVSPSDVHRYRNMVDVLLAPYSESGVAMRGGRGDSSAYMNPMKLVEYMASRKAIVASDIPAVREMLEHMQTGYLCKADDVGEWVCALQCLETNPELRRDLAGNAYGKFRANYTWEDRARKLTCI